MLIETIDEWLPKLSEWLQYIHKTYPILIHGVPTSFNMLRDGSDINLGLIEDNSEIITRSSALRNVKFLGPNGGQVPQKTHGLLVLYFTDPVIVNACIDRQVMLHGGLLPAVKFVSHPPRCFKCHHTGHIVCYCKARRKCGMCAGDHDTRNCAISRRDGPTDQPALPKCAVCSGPHTVSDTGCPAHRAAIDKHRAEVAEAGPFYPVRS